ncbi:MAG: site-2 protease family protein [Actinomycetota bacterium]|nr:site-2 protease family protein [Actinomycetota bacterium]
MTAVGVVAFVVALLVSVMLHEAGHFVTARRYGMKATQFFVGFGPTVFSRQRGETEYGVKAIPAGGFVKIVGMTPLEDVPAADEDRAFYRQPAGRRAVVLSAGSFMHFVIAVLLTLAVTAAVGVVDDTAPVVAAPTACVPLTVTATVTPPKGCPSDSTVPSPARAAGLLAGDRILRAGDRPISTYRQFVEAVRSHAGRPLVLSVRRHQAVVGLTLTPVPVVRPDLDHPASTVAVGAIGVQQELVTKRLSLTGSIAETGRRLGLIVSGTYTSLTSKLGTITDLYGPHRDPTGLVGAVGAAHVSGQILDQGGVSLAVRISDFLLLIAGLNLFVGVFNLLPLLPLDGGHIAILVYEQARDRVRRLRGYRGPLQRVDLTKLMPVTYAVVLLFIGLTLYIMGADIINPVRIGQ